MSHRILFTIVASVSPHHVAKADRKGRTRGGVDEVICWLIGFDAAQVADRLADDTTFEDSSRRHGCIRTPG